jgi:cellulose synthase/poly-beta-1,6-N-acetylglucosamine synthase-like glycosyltransferase
VLQANESMIKEQGKKSAISRAVEIANGELILATDADTSHGPHWVSFIVAKYCKSDLKMVVAPVAFQNERTVFQKIQSLEFMGLMGTTIGSAAAGFPVMCNGANIAYSRDAYLDTGGFTGNMQFSSGDDQFLMSSIGKKFGRQAIGTLANIEAFVFTNPLSTVRSFFNQRLRWVSKSRGYKDAAVISLAFLTYSVHLLLLTGIVYGLFYPRILIFSLLLLLIKMVVEYPIVWLMARLLSKKKLLGYYFIAQVFQLFYVPIMGFLGNIISYDWKGRRGR